VRADLRKNGIRTLTSNCSLRSLTHAPEQWRRNLQSSSAIEYANLEGSVYIAGTRPQPSSVVAFENYYQALPNNPCR